GDVTKFLDEPVQPTREGGFKRLSLWLLGGVLILFSNIVWAQPTAIVVRQANVDGVKLHYLTAGHGPAVVLLHGYAQTSRIWRPIIPLLAERFTVIAPDLPGIGESEIPAGKLD